MTGEAGQVLTGRYRLQEPIGDGRRALWTALDEWSSRTVLLTHVPVPDDPGLAASIRRAVGREVERAAGLDNPHLGRVLGAVTDDGRTLWVASETRAGVRTLHDVLGAADDIAADRLAGWGHDIADGLAALHAHGLVHRDVRAGLALIHDDGSAALAAVAATADLGAAAAGDAVAPDTPEDDVRALVALMRTALPPAPTEPDDRARVAALVALLDRPGTARTAGRLRDELAATMAHQPSSPHSWWERPSS